MITIAGAMAGDFTANAPCTANLVCTVRILEGNRVGNLVLMPTSDAAVENSEEWTATLVDGGGNYNFAANNNVAFDITDPPTPGPMIPSLPVVGIATGDMPIEDGAGVTLTITSSETVPATLTGGLTVTIDITGADAAEFTSGNCNALVCEVVILATEMTALLTITASTDSDAEGGSEDWTATIAPDTDNNIFMVDSNADDAVFAVGNMLPPVVDGTMLMALNDYTPPTVLAADAIRNRLSDAVRGVVITASLYADASVMPQIYVQLLEFAALGIWVNGNTPAINGDDHDFDYAFLGDNVVATLPNSGSATYRVEGDATYKGVNFFPDGIIAADFGAGVFATSISADGSTAATRTDDYGSATAMVPDGSGGMRPVTGTDSISINLDGTISGNEFQGTPIFTVDGFFSDLAGFDSAASSFSGRFYDSDTYDPTATTPRELAGVMEIIDDQGNLNMGFLGRRP